jgi:hypothetical protein
VNTAIVDHRQTGRTTRQLEALPLNSVFIVAHGHESNYVRRLAYKLGRLDIVIQPLTWLLDVKWRGLTFPGADIDHHAREVMGAEHHIAWHMFQSRIPDSKGQT